MPEVKVFYPTAGSQVDAPLVPYGTSKDVHFLVGVLQDQGTGNIIFGRTLHECSYWDILFAETPNGTYTFLLIGFPGGLLESVPNIQIVNNPVHGVTISQPTPRQQNLTACFTAAGYANPGGMPSGTVTEVSTGTVYQGTNATQYGTSWTIKFTVVPVPVATSLFDLDIAVAGSGNAANNGLGIPNPCS